MFRTGNPFRSAGQKQIAHDMSTYLPPHIEQAMTEHLQNTMPDHLQKYQQDGAYMPQSAANSMQQHMESSLPPHLKQYAGAYMQQRVVRPGMASPSISSSAPGGAEAPTPQPHPPAPNMSIYTGTGEVTPTATASGFGQPQPPTQTIQPSAPPAPDSPDAAYNFITDSAPPPRRSLSDILPGGNSMGMRIGLVAACFFILLIVVLIFKSILGASGNAATQALMGVIQDQQELIHLSSSAFKEPTLTAGNKNLTSTVQVTVGSSQSQIIGYLARNGKKVQVKELNLKVSSSIDSQLTDAATANTYNQTFQQIIKSQLDTYGSDLQKAYKQIKGKEGRTLLTDSFNQIKLFETQLESPSS